MNTPTAQSILDMAHGAFKERTDYEMARVIENILDPNTIATKERSVTVTIKLKPDDSRQNISVLVEAKSKLQPTAPMPTSLYVTGDNNGEIQAVEMVPQIPGQQNLDGEEQECSKVLHLVKKNA